MVALTSIGVALAFALRNVTAATGTFVVLVLMPVMLNAAAKVTYGNINVMVAGTQMDAFELISRPFLFLFPTGIMMTTQLRESMVISGFAGQWSLGVSSVWLLLATLAGLVAFRRREFR